MELQWEGSVPAACTVRLFCFLVKVVLVVVDYFPGCYGGGGGGGDGSHGGGTLKQEVCIESPFKMAHSAHTPPPPTK